MMLVMINDACFMLDDDCFVFGRCLFSFLVIIFMIASYFMQIELWHLYIYLDEEDYEQQKQYDD